MGNDYQGDERRKFFRYNYKKSLRYSVVSPAKGRDPISIFIDGVAKNLSASGILFTTDSAPQISSFLLLDLDYQTASVCEEIEDRALIVNNKLLGKVVRIEDNENGSWDVGVAFVTKSEQLVKEVKNLVR